jgi:DNA polymerase-3 subunit delta'
VTYPWLLAVEAEFAERLRGGRLAHALLLAGPAGTGKSELARRLLAGVLCLEGRYPACGACRSCELLAGGGAHPDGHLVSFEKHPKKDEPRSELVINQIRSLTAALQLTSTISSRKAAVIHPAEAMTRSAANALLKTLEEPPGDAVLFLVSHQAARLPATIRSRCQALDVRLPAHREAREWLASESGCSAEDADRAVEAAAGSPLTALRMLDEGGGDAYRAVSEALGDLRSGRREPPAVMAEMGDIEPQLLWSWLSLRSASETRRQLESPPLARALASLQRAADRNRDLLSTPVRKDLLLQDWLIQWSRLDG